MGMFELLLNKYNISFNEVFEIREVKTNRLTGTFYFIRDNENIFKLRKKRLNAFITVSSRMIGDILTAIMMNRVYIVKTNKCIK